MALFHNFLKLRKDNVFVFDKDLKIARTAADLVGTPIWSLEQARKKSENLTQRLGAEIGRLLKRQGDHVAILSAENLALFPIVEVPEGNVFHRRGEPFTRELPTSLACGWIREPPVARGAASCSIVGTAT
jgi:hypothetical protein